MFQFGSPPWPRSPQPSQLTRGSCAMMDPYQSVARPDSRFESDRLSMDVLPPTNALVPLKRAQLTLAAL